LHLFMGASCVDFFAILIYNVELRH
jgi:hypothetical protein